MKIVLLAAVVCFCLSLIFLAGPQAARGADAAATTTTDDQINAKQQQIAQLTQQIAVLQAEITYLQALKQAGVTSVPVQVVALPMTTAGAGACAQAVTQADACGSSAGGADSSAAGHRTPVRTLLRRLFGGGRRGAGSSGGCGG